ncbi:MAG: FHA domain-containing protein [Oscillospiraceae bacterium]|nr:FHA domain-containing protein [Oscillospiraceae bacterium]
MSVFEILSTLFSYIFITIIYLFIFSIIRLIYMDIKLTMRQSNASVPDDAPTFEEVDDDNDDEYEDFGDYFGILRVVEVRETVGNLSDEYILDKDVVTIGRAGSNSKCDVQIDDQFLSGEHLELTFDGRYWRARDLGSRNGTFVNDESIDACELRNGDRIAIGSVIFELRL